MWHTAKISMNLSTHKSEKYTCVYILYRMIKKCIRSLMIYSFRTNCISMQHRIPCAFTILQLGRIFRLDYICLISFLQICSPFCQIKKRLLKLLVHEYLHTVNMPHHSVIEIKRNPHHLIPT